MFGARISLAIGAMVVVATGVFGTLIGAVAGYFPRLDQPLMRLMDALMAFPSIVLAIVVSAVLGASVTNVVIALSIATTPHTARIVRASVLVGARDGICRGRARARRERHAHPAPPRAAQFARRR